MGGFLLFYYGKYVYFVAMENLRHYFMPASYELPVSVKEILQEVVDLNSNGIQSPVFSLSGKSHTYYLFIKENESVEDVNVSNRSALKLTKGVRAFLEVKEERCGNLSLRRFPHVLRDDDGKVEGFIECASSDGYSSSIAFDNNHLFIKMLGEMLQKFASDHPSIEESFDGEIPERDRNVVEFLKSRQLV